MFLWSIFTATLQSPSPGQPIPSYLSSIWRCQTPLRKITKNFLDWYCHGCLISQLMNPQWLETFQVLLNLKNLQPPPPSTSPLSYSNSSPWPSEPLYLSSLPKAGEKMEANLRIPSPPPTSSHSPLTLCVSPIFLSPWRLTFSYVLGRVCHCHLSHIFWNSVRVAISLSTYENPWPSVKATRQYQEASESTFRRAPFKQNYVWCMPAIPTLKRQIQEDQQLQASLGYIMRICLIKAKSKQKWR